MRQQQALQASQAPIITITMHSVTALMTSRTNTGAHAMKELGVEVHGLLSSSHYAFDTSGEVIGAYGTVRVFRQKFTLEDAIGSHA
jgi:hypothetical protein